MHSKCTTNACQVFSKCIANSWQTHSNSMATAWRMNGNCMATAWRMHGKCIAKQANALQMHGKGIAHAWQVHGNSRHSEWNKTNGFKASDPSVSRAGHEPSVPQAGHELQPMVLRHQIRSLTSWACVTTNGFKASEPSVPQAGHALKPMVLRPRISTVKPVGETGETSKWQLKNVGQRTNGWCPDGFVLLQTLETFGTKSYVFSIRLAKNKSVCTSTIGSLADGFQHAQVHFWGIRSVQCLDSHDEQKPMVLRDQSDASSLTMNNNQWF